MDLGTKIKISKDETDKMLILFSSNTPEHFSARRKINFIQTNFVHISYNVTSLA